VIRLRRSLGLTVPGRALKRALGREVRIPVLTEPRPEALIPRPAETLPDEVADERLLVDALSWVRGAAVRGPRSLHELPPAPGLPGPEGTGLANLVFVSHCDFTGNSALHVYAIATELHRRGYSPIIAVPENADTVEDVGRPAFPVLTYDEARVGPLVFPDGRGPDLVVAFTPRELVREVTVELVRSHGCRYLVHLEDNDEVVLSGELGGADSATLRALPLPELDRIIQPRQWHPLRGARLLEHAAGMTILVDRLLGLVPEGVPAALVRAGFDESVLETRRLREDVRAEIGLDPADTAIVYTGNVHALNRGEVRDLYAAVGLLRRNGRRVVLVKTGWGSGVAATFPSLGPGLRDLGWVPRASIPDLLAAADILIQPGGPGPFNDFRFPSKLPEYLASGRPVVLPRTNIGLELRNGGEAILLERGDAAEIVAAVERLMEDPELGKRVAAGGRAFALRELRWSASVDSLERLFAVVSRSRRPPAPAWALDGADPPAKLVAVVREPLTAPDVSAARANGVFGFCLDIGGLSELPGVPPAGIPFCAMLDDAGQGVAQVVSAWFGIPGYMRVADAPLLLCRSPGPRLREIVEQAAGQAIHLASPDDHAAGSLDALVETMAAVDDGYESVLTTRLSKPLPDGPFYRSVAPPRSTKQLDLYSIWLRKLVLQAALRAPAQSPFVFVDASELWPDAPARRHWLSATRKGVEEGIAQYYLSRGLRVGRADLEAIIRST
jgi:glycosyltransferase involved in cell wall biosynthesis